MIPDKLRVRTARTYNASFHSDIGQKNAEIVRKRLTPLTRYYANGDAVAFAGPGYDVIHTLGAVPLFSRTPFVITFEDYLPRVPEDRPNPRLEAWLRRRLLSERCVALLPKSEYAIRQFRKQNAGFDRLPELEAKMELLYPGVPIRRTAPKAANPVLKLLFVGNDFMRKGLPVLTRAHAALKSRGVPVETTVISSLAWSPDDYIGPPDAGLVERERRALDQEGLTILGKVPNDETRRLMEAADYLVLPTFHDTFGFVGIEALAAATPVISTATAAQPEIVIDGKSGWLLAFDNDAEVGKWAWIYRKNEPSYLDAFRAQVETLAADLTDTLARAWEDRADYETLSQGALDHARARFDIEPIRRRTEEIYERCRRR